MINTKQHGGPAFPTERQLDGAGDLFVAETFGMTLRDYFAAKVLASLVTTDEDDIEGSVALAYSYADAMLNERKR